MTKTVLIVDDELSIVEALRFLMEQNGYAVEIAIDGEGALEMIAKVVPDLLLLDIMLPGIDGYEICELVRLNPEWRKIKIIFLTAKGRQEDIAKGMILGADDYVVKPFSNADIVRRVKRLLEQEETNDAA
jgi:DNA-binding response OmpR family regulator